MEKMISSQQLKELLQNGVAKGYWTLEDLDTPPPGYAMLWADNKGHYHRYRVPQRPYTNPLRDCDDA